MQKDLLVKIGTVVGAIIILVIIFLLAKSYLHKEQPPPPVITQTSTKPAISKSKFKEVTEKYPTGELMKKYLVYPEKPDVKHGAYVEYYKSGNKLCGLEFKENLPVGRLTCWYDVKGQAPKSLEGNFEGGKKNGTFTEWHQNGKIKFTYTYKVGVLNGPWIEFYEDGTKMTEMNYEEGVRTGVLKRYKPDGSVKYETQMKEPKSVKTPE